MKITRDDIMGMPITVEIVDNVDSSGLITETFSFFEYVDKKFSTYKDDSEISLINKGIIEPATYSEEVKEILKLSEQTKRETNGYFDIITPDGKIAPLGMVKGWAIYKAALKLTNLGVKNFYINAGGDVQAMGRNSNNEYFRIGIMNPFNTKEIIKTVALKDGGIATSGTYVRGQHIYNPLERDKVISDIVSLTVIGPNIYEADRFATAAFAMGREGINFIEKLDGFEGYMVDRDGTATMTSGFEKYVIK